METQATRSGSARPCNQAATTSTTQNRNGVSSQGRQPTPKSYPTFYSPPPTSGAVMAVAVPMFE